MLSRLTWLFDVRTCPVQLSTLISKRLAVQAFVVSIFAVLALLQTSPANAASASKSCSVTTPNVYACTFTIVPGVAVGAGSWLVQTVGPGTFTSPSVVSSNVGCSSAAVTAGGTPINPPTSTAVSDYNVTIGGTGCSPSAVVVVTETITVTSTGSVCQTVWITAGMPSVNACANVTYSAAPPSPSATKACVLTSTPNRYACTFTVFPAFPAVAGDMIHVNELPGPPMTGPGTIVPTPTVSVVSGCAQVPAPVTMTGTNSYTATIGSSGCPGTAWSVQFLETIDVTASGQICQSFYMVAAVPPTTTCATVTYTPVAGPSATKTCVTTSTPNVYTCTFTINPGIAVSPGAWLVQMVTPGPGTFSGPSVVSSATTGCGSLPTIAAGTLISTPQGIADYNVAIGAGGCTSAASVVITETVTVTAAGQLCQTVWITTAMPGVTACATVQFAKSLTFTGGTIAPVGVSIVSFTGTVLQLDAAGAANTPKVTSVSATAGGKLITYVIGAPSFVNVEFNAAFPMGLNATLVVVKTG
jgi:hypothetical protein